MTCTQRKSCIIMQSIRGVAVAVLNRLLSVRLQTTYSNATSTLNQSGLVEIRCTRSCGPPGKCFPAFMGTLVSLGLVLDFTPINVCSVVSVYLTPMYIMDTSSIYDQAAVFDPAGRIMSMVRDRSRPFETARDLSRPFETARDTDLISALTCDNSNFISLRLLRGCGARQQPRFYLGAIGNHVDLNSYTQHVGPHRGRIRIPH